MEHYSVYELLWLFYIYSFLGWIFEVVLAACRQRKFANRGLVNGPFCVIYGIAAVLMSVGLREMSGPWLFLFAVVYATAVEWVAGHLIEKAFKERWWNYSNIKWNLDGYICLPMSLCWGLLGFVTVRWGNGFVLGLISMLPSVLMHILLLVLMIALAVDVLASYILLKGRGKYLAQWEAANEQLDKVSFRLRKTITGIIDRRIHKAYPKAVRTTHAEAAGEMAGVWMSRSSVVWGPFSIVWGLAIALGTAMLYRYKDRSDGFLFGVGTLLGGGYEYLCSVFTEIVFGKVFWDYSKLPFNLGGRINLLYCFFWGIAAVVWFKKIYPFAARWIEKIPMKAGKLLTWVLIVFMCCNVAVSCVALVRYDERSKGIAAESSWQQWADEHYDDAKMAKIYPNAKVAK